MSAVMSDQSSNNVAEFFSPGPGERLRAARLSMGFDLAKIASELHLTTQVVEALEADDYSDFSARVFVRGYLRNYARIVGMPVESILRQFDEKWPDEGARNAVIRQSPRLPADAGPSRGLAGAVTWLLVIGVIVLFLMWWRGYLDELVPPEMRASSLVEGRVTDSAPGEAGTAGGGLFPADSEPSLADGSLRLPAPPPEVEPEPAAAESIELGAPAITEQATEPSIADLAPLAGSSVETQDVVTDAATAPPVVASDPATPTVALAPPADGGAPVVDGTKQVVLTFHAACWVDVRDSDRGFKLFGEMPKGTRKVLGGQPPYKLVIGNAQAVTITVNGKPVDLTPYAKGNVARFTLDP